MNALMSLQVLEPRKGALAMRALEALLLLARLGLSVLPFANGGFHEEPMAALPSALWLALGIGGAGRGQISEQSQEPVWVVLETVG